MLKSSPLLRSFSALKMTLCHRCLPVKPSRVVRQSQFLYSGLNLSLASAILHARKSLQVFSKKTGIETLLGLTPMNLLFEQPWRKAYLPRLTPNVLKTQKGFSKFFFSDVFIMSLVLSLTWWGCSPKFSTVIIWNLNIIYLITRVFLYKTYYVHKKLQI